MNQNFNQREQGEESTLLKKERVLREVHKPVWAVEDNAPIPGGPDFVLEVDHGLLPHAVRQRQGILHADRVAIRVELKPTETQKTHKNKTL